MHQQHMLSAYKAFKKITRPTLNSRQIVQMKNIKYKTLRKHKQNLPSIFKSVWKNFLQSNPFSALQIHCLNSLLVDLNSYIKKDSPI